MKTITIKDNETGEQLIITADTYFIAYNSGDTNFKTQGHVQSDFIYQLIRKYGAKEILKIINKWVVFQSMLSIPEQ